MSAIPSDASSTAYAYRPSVLGAPWEFALSSDAISFQAGRKAGRVLFRDIERVRLSFRPSTTQTKRYVTEIRGRGAPKFDLVSTSWKSMVEQERRDTAYVAFVSELHRRLAEANVPARFETGINPIVYWCGVAVFAVVSFALAGLVVRGLQAQFWGGTAFIAAFFGAFIWQSGNYFRRNRPGTYDPRVLPADLMPKL